MTILQGTGAAPQFLSSAQNVVYRHDSMHQMFAPHASKMPKPQFHGIGRRTSSLSAGATELIAPSPEIEVLVRQRAKKFRPHLAEVPNLNAPLVTLKGLEDEHLIHRLNWQT